MSLMYTSRSSVEAYQDCPRYRFNQYHHSKTGLVSVSNSVPLVTGSAIHRGVEHALNRVRIGQEPDVEVAVSEAVRQYDSDCLQVGFRGKGTSGDRQQEFTYGEQRALTEALVRVWHIVELPCIRKRYKVLDVEREIKPLELTHSYGIMFQARVDAEFQEIQSNDYHNYSLKTIASWGEKEEADYKSDLQGVTEIWSVEEDARRWNGSIGELVTKLYLMDELGTNIITQDKLVQIAAFLEKKKVEKKVMGIRFCILIKGKRYKPNYEDALYTTYSPLIRGYKHFTPNGIEYAHSWTYPNQNNQSGTSKLGQGWEPFNVWESDISIKTWIDFLASGQCQPECGDVLKMQVVQPVEYFRDEEDLRVGMMEVESQEKTIKKSLDLIREYDTIEMEKILASTFPHVRKKCNWMYGSQCEYKSLCWSPEVRNDPIGSGLYQVRIPHHAEERGARPKGSV